MMIIKIIIKTVNMTNAQGERAGAAQDSRQPVSRAYHQVEPVPTHRQAAIQVLME